MSSFLFLTCCFLIIIACSEGANTDAKKLETRRVCLRTDFPTGCNHLDFEISYPQDSGSYTDSQLTSFNQKFSRLCTKACVSAVTEYLRCDYSRQYSGNQLQERLEYRVNYIQKYICGQHSNGDYCPVRLQRGYIGSTTTSTDRSNARAFINIIRLCSWSPYSGSNTGITCSSSTSSRCTDTISTFSSYMGCCAEPLLGSGVRSCSGVSVPEACTGVSGATGIMATAPIVAVSLMVFALVGVLL